MYMNNIRTLPDILNTIKDMTFIIYDNEMLVAKFTYIYIYIYIISRILLEPLGLR
jgi:hypothetical protein